MAEGAFRLKERRDEGIGLTVLERVAAADPAEGTVNPPPKPAEWYAGCNEQLAGPVPAPGPCASRRSAAARADSAPAWPTSFAERKPKLGQEFGACTRWRRAAG